MTQSCPQATPDDVCRWIDYSLCPGGPFLGVDPIDGTKGFLRSDQYAVALALVVDGQVQLGLLGCPSLADATGQTWKVLARWSSPHAAWTTPLAQPGSFERLQVSQRSFRPTPACFARSNLDTPTSGRSTCSPRPWAYRPNRCAWTARPSTPCWPPARGTAASPALLRQADYRKDLGSAAGSIVVEEAGGKITDLHGKPLDFTAGRTWPAIEASWPQHPAPPGCPGCTESYRSLKIREA